MGVDEFTGDCRTCGHDINGRTGRECSVCGQQICLHCATIGDDEGQYLCDVHADMRRPVLDQSTPPDAAEGATL